MKPTTAEIEQHLGLVYKVVNSNLRYTTHLIEKGDLLAWGTEGVIHALKRFDPTRGFTFSTYAVRCIHGYILQGLRSTRKEIWYAKARGFEATTVELTEKYAKGLVDDKNTAKAVTDEVEFNMLMRHLDTAVFSPRQKEIVKLMVENEFHQHNVSKMLGCTRANVSIVWRTAMRNARKSLGVN